MSKVVTALRELFRTVASYTATPDLSNRDREHLLNFRFSSVISALDTDHID